MEALNCSISKLNSKKKIYKIFSIPLEAQKDGYDFSKCYEYKWIDKKERKDKTPFKELVLSLEKPKRTIVDIIPSDRNESDYRPIINYKPNYTWLKRSQRKLHKIITNGLGEISYLHSTLSRKSYATNGREHANKIRQVLCIDISSFFTQISKKRVYDIFKQYLQVDSDVADFYSSLCTAPVKKESDKIVLAQGLPTSPILAFLCYKSLFDYINEISIKHGITFTLYVDDMTFSSEEEIPQSFIDTIIGILKSKRYNNLLKINTDKIHLYRKESNKKITGVIIKNGVSTIPSKKHYEIVLLYDKLIELINNEPYTFDDYLITYPHFLKYMGNIMYLFQVVYDMKKDDILNSKHAIFYRLYEELVKYFKPGIKKNNIYEKYSKTNIDKEDIKKMEKQYLSMLLRVPYIKAIYKSIK